MQRQAGKLSGDQSTDERAQWYLCPLDGWILAFEHRRCRALMRAPCRACLREIETATTGPSPLARMVNASAARMPSPIHAVPRAPHESPPIDCKRSAAGRVAVGVAAVRGMKRSFGVRRPRFADDSLPAYWRIDAAPTGRRVGSPLADDG